ncbi:MAG: hypothetical protein ABI439_12135, partial [Rhodospirillales bacterium]
AIERLGGKLLPRFAGVVMIEAAKQLYAATGLIPVEPVPARAKLRVIGPSAARDTKHNSQPPQD